MYIFKLRPKLFPYEKKFAWAEINNIALSYDASIKKITNVKYAVVTDKNINIALLRNVTYFREIILPNGNSLVPNITKWESSSFVSGGYSTRYSAHGIHEYKGKFNPQVVHSLLNQYLGFNYTNKTVYDPFAGSGTTLLEASLMGISSAGTDVNPLAVLISKAKQNSLEINMQQLVKYWEKAEEYARNKKEYKLIINDSRLDYLANWFPIETLTKLELVRNYILKLPTKYKEVLEVIVSNLLREYSYQEPKDLRIRRRKQIPEQTEILEAINNKVHDFADRMKRFKKVYNQNPVINNEYLISSEDYESPQKYNLALTSPPYATALPYIDTQRLSIIWCDLAEPSQIKELDQNLIGTRESSKAHLECLRKNLKNNVTYLPESVIAFLRKLQSSINYEKDGFRRQATPALLYQYFVEMQNMFKNVKNNLKKDAFYLLIVGTNKTTLGGTKFIIDTPVLLGDVAKSQGWKLINVTPLQTYKRYGINAKNSVNEEKLLILKK